jgi:branched-chain amino acid transport system permease protein
MAPRPDRTRQRILLAAAVASLALFPLVDSPFYLELVTKVMILSIFAMSLDLLVGCTGLVSLGHAAFFGTGAYALALMTPRFSPASFWVTLPVAVASGAAAALLVGFFVVRLKSVYFIMATLAFAQVFFFVAHDTEFGRGSDGISMNFRPEALVGEKPLFDLTEPVHTYYLVLLFLVTTTAFLRRLLRTPFGHALLGIRSNEHRMRSLGYATFRYKLAAFVLAGTLAGLSGYLYVAQRGFVNPEMLSWHQSGNVLVMVILGGMGTFHGAVLGAFAFTLLQEAFQSLTLHWQLLLGATVVAVVLLLPGGLEGIRDRFRAALTGRTGP